MSQPPHIRDSAPSLLDGSESYLTGKMLIAMPTMGDPRFERTLIYMCAHSEEGAMGLVVNKHTSSLRFPDLLDKLGIKAEPGNDCAPLPNLRILSGGPVECGRGFVLHSQDYDLSQSTMSVSQTVSLTATLDIIKAIAAGHGPAHAILTLGYSGWSPGQLEQEMQNNGWLHCDPDDALLFDEDLDTKYDRALAKLGIDVSFLSTDAGHA